MSVLEKLTEGIVERSLRREGAALVNKWSRTGLLEGMGDHRNANNMARLLENQAKDLLREASSMESGKVEGFASVAFPIVRRVFGGLLAQDIVSVQPMSLPSGLIFFLDFTHESNRLDSGEDTSLYGGNVVGRQITGGVDQKYVSSANMNANEQNAALDRGFYNLNGAYSSPTGSADVTGSAGFTLHIDAAAADATAAGLKMIRFDPDVLNLDTSTHQVAIVKCALSNIETIVSKLNKRFTTFVSFDCSLDAAAVKLQQVRRLSVLGSSTAHPSEDAWDGTEDTLYCVLLGKNAEVQALGDGSPAAGEDAHEPGLTNTWKVTFPEEDKFASAGDPSGLGAIKGDNNWGLEDEKEIPEINIKVDSIAVTAVTKKLKARWTPELGQDLNAYHNLDAEVELTSILSEQIALEIDQEILNDLVQGAKAGTMYWSRSPGLFVNRETGAEIGAQAKAPDFTGTVSEWYETLVETINDVSARIHRKTLRGGANFCVCSPEVANILEFTSGFRANVTADENKGTIGAVNVGSISKKFDLYVDPYFPRNLILVGRKGNSFLESGYVYAPYVPLQVTPTIFGEDDFTPRKGVMTRYAKQMVKPDMYGLVVVRGLIGESGA